MNILFLKLQYYYSSILHAEYAELNENYPDNLFS